MKRVVRKSRVDKPFNAGTMSSAGFFGFVRSALRAKSMFWKPISETKKSARRKYSGINKRQRWEYECSKCHNFFMDKQVAVHHITPVGTLKCYADLPQFVENLFCE